jgi:anti-sigma factor ChrR (cupin superfamily)
VDQQRWLESGTPLLSIKPLFEDSSTGQRAWLMEIAARAHAPDHSHEETEQIYVISGEF